MISFYWSWSYKKTIQEGKGPGFTFGLVGNICSSSLVMAIHVIMSMPCCEKDMAFTSLHLLRHTWLPGHPGSPVVVPGNDDQTGSTERRAPGSLLVGQASLGCTGACTPKTLFSPLRTGPKAPGVPKPCEPVWLPSQTCKASSWPPKTRIQTE